LSDQDVYVKILSILNEYYDKDALHFVPSSELCVRLGMPLDEIYPFATELEQKGYVQKEEGTGPSFLLKLCKKGINAINGGDVEMSNECELYHFLNQKTLDILYEEYVLGNLHFVPEEKLISMMGISSSDASFILEGLKYNGFLIKLKGPHLSKLQITDLGIKHVEQKHSAGKDRVKYPKFEVYRDPKDKFRFRLKAPNGEIIASSQAYTSKASCLKGIDSIKRNAIIAKVSELT